MKLLDDKGKLFGRINILDFIALIVVLFFVFVLYLNFSKQSLSSLGTVEEPVTGKIVVSIVMEPGYYDVIKPGAQISEDKRYFDMEVTDVVVQPYMIATVDDQGKVMTFEDPTQQEAIVTIEGEFIKKGAAYKLGKQEIRQGIKLYVESELFKYSGTVIDFEVNK
ncbi:MAG: DUF4330 domain-containing protein [Firmicutes bacterium]|nr:DUF4330 domain-containing protein [Bacillota bacterium]